jgi:hypothetical protein
MSTNATTVAGQTDGAAKAPKVAKSYSINFAAVDGTSLRITAMRRGDGTTNVAARPTREAAGAR